MGVFRSLMKSLRMDNLKVVLYGWLFNLFLGFIALFFSIQFITAYTQKSFIQNQGSLQENLEFLLNIIHINNSSQTILITFLLILVLLYILVSIFVSAGSFYLFITDEKRTLKQLVSFSFMHFFKILKIFLINLLSISVAVLSSVALFYSYFNTRDSIAVPFLNATILVFCIVYTAFAMVFAKAVYDFSRIIKLKYNRNIIFSFYKAITFVWTKKIPLTILICIFITLAGILMVLLSTVQSQFSGVAPIYFTFIFYQIFFFLQHILKVSLMNSEVNFFDITIKTD